MWRENSLIKFVRLSVPGRRAVEARYFLVTCFDSAQQDRVSYDLLFFLSRYR
ncbi:hypothetical protein MUK70_19725 [Dyadobacter chenwenxiniae]|uniref:Uncharacterized protein n=1 Tax=Dyadobacter chenwenxiniae TaxID=2906456 RepID=A0A9X1PI43_9BACT|nr:hypothetical protein [Dyadobacter chenwenxiniae]MCF0061470.1 hypothetical protein [Dyadobacter chenwenxiniae]UON81293.1 hypothetical protein MUK70_19725 [Dyadobacter chenwenxiniae]